MTEASVGRVAKAGKKVVLFNVKYSENLGDGLISETIEAHLLRSPAIASVRVLDLAGRTAFGENAVRNRSAKLMILGLLPRPLRHMAVGFELGRRLRRLEPEWREAIRTADHVVIGGGHLFQDDGLNFPIKVGAVLSLCADLKVPVTIFAVGVTSEWSKRARDLFLRLGNCAVSDISVRDEASRDNWSAHFAGTAIPPARLCPDPVLSLDLRKLPEKRDAIGLCVTHPRVIAHHANVQVSGLIDFYVGALERLCQDGNQVTLFSNGASEDEGALDDLVSRGVVSDLLHNGKVRRAPRPLRPEDLVHTISQFRGVVAHRLHANITAYALGIPCVGLGWDSKLEAFFRRSGIARSFLPAEGMTIDRLVRQVDETLSIGIETSEWQKVRSSAATGLESLVAAIAESRTT